MYLKHPSQIQSILVGNVSFLLRALLTEEGDWREDDVGESASVDASDFTAGASRTDVDNAPPRLPKLPLRDMPLPVDA